MSIMFLLVIYELPNLNWFKSQGLFFDRNKGVTEYEMTGMYFDCTMMNYELTVMEL